MRTILVLACVLLTGAILLQGCAATTPPPGAVETAATRPAGEDYSREVARLVSEEDQVVSILANGMTVIVQRVPSPVVSIRGYVKAGGMYEGKWLGGGLSHLLEHLVAGGTNDRRSEEENRNLLQAIGNNSNAYTTQDQTSYFINTTADNLEKGVDLVTGWMLTSHITKDQYAREYEVVQRELEKDKGEPDWVFYEMTQRNRYRVSPARVPVIGYQEVIRGLSRDDVYAYYKLAYVPNNMLFVVAGDLPPETMLAAVRKHVKEAAPGRSFEHDIAEEPPVVAPRTLVATFPRLGQAKLELAFPSVKLAQADMYPLDLLATALATGESSILVEELRDKRQLISAVQAYDYTPNFVEGTFAIQMELEVEKIPEATKATLEILEKIAAEGIGAERLKRAQVQTKTQRAFSKQTSDEVANTLAGDFLSTGDVRFSDRYVERMAQVTDERIKETARMYLVRQKLLTTALLPEEAVGTGGLAKAEQIIRAAAQGPATRAAEKNQVVRLEMNDGMTLLLKRVETAPIVTMRMYALGGLTAEDQKSNGLGSLAMQSAQRGTKLRSAREIAEYFDSVGGQLGTQCGNNSWNWSAACLKEDFAKTVEVFLDVVQNPAFPDAEVEAVKKRTVAGIEAQDADWFAGAMRFFRKEYFGEMKSPYQFMSIGQKQTVSGFTPEQTRDWYAQKVLKSKRVLAVFGDMDVKEAEQLLAPRFGGVREGAGDGRGPLKPTARPSNDVPAVEIRRVAVNKTSNPQAGVIIGFDAGPWVGGWHVSELAMADTLVSGYGYPTGYIFELLRGKGLVYDANAMVFPGRDFKTPGTFLVYAGCDPKDVNEVVEVILENMARLQGSDDDIMKDWFERAKKLAITSDALENETSAAQAQAAALDELFGLGYDYHAGFADRIQRVKLEEVRLAAKLLLSRCVITVSTNDPAAVTIKAGAKTYKSFAPVDMTPKGVGHDSK